MFVLILELKHKEMSSLIYIYPPRCWLHLIVVRSFEYVSDPEIYKYTSGSVATGRASLAGQVKGRRQKERETKT